MGKGGVCELLSSELHGQLWPVLLSIWSRMRHMVSDSDLECHWFPDTHTRHVMFPIFIAVLVYNKISRPSCIQLVEHWTRWLMLNMIWQTFNSWHITTIWLLHVHSHTIWGIIWNYDPCCPLAYWDGIYPTVQPGFETPHVPACWSYRLERQVHLNQPDCTVESLK